MTNITSSTLAPRKLGRPRIHEDKHARDAPASRNHRRKNKLNKLGTTSAKAAAAWNKLSDAQKVFVEECVSLTKRIQNARLQEDIDEVTRLTGMLQYVEQIERQRIREEK